MAREKVLSELFYPEGIKCIVCDAELSKDTRYCVCDSCKLPYNTDFCERCGRENKSAAKYCDVCQHKKWNFDFARSSLNYVGDVKNLVYRFKYGNEKYLAKYLGEFMTDTFYKSDFSADAITFVPLHKTRLKSRGYNQSELLAKRIGELTSLPVFDLLEKVVVTKNLARLNAQQRRLAIEDSFELNDDEFELFFNTMRDIHGNFRMENVDLLLIDDMFTTGVTSNECAKVLKQAGIGHVMVLCLASAPSRPTLI